MAAKVEKTPSYLSDIENNRRIPAEEVLRELAKRLDVNFDDLMARAGRFGEDVERYMRQTPAAGVLFRKVSEKKLTEENLKKVSEYVEAIEGKSSKK